MYIYKLLQCIEYNHKISFSRRRFGALSTRTCNLDSNYESQVFYPPLENSESFQDSCNPDLKESLKECYNVDDVCKVYVSFKESLGPFSLLYVLSRIAHVSTRKRQKLVEPFLFDANEYCAVSLDQRIGTVNIMHMDVRVGNLYTRILSKLDYLSITQLAYLYRIGLHIRGYHNELIKAEAEGRLIVEMPNLSNIDLCRIACTFAIASSNTEFLKTASQVIISRLKSMEPIQRLFVFQTMAGLRFCSNYFLQEAAGKVLDSFTFTGPSLVKILACYAARPKSASPQFFQKLLNECLSLDLSTTLSGTEACDLIYVTSKYSDGCHLILAQLHDTVIKNIPKYSPRNLAMLIWAVGNSRYDSLEMIEALENGAMACVENMTPSQLTLVAHGLSLVTDICGKFLERIQSDIIKHIGHFNGLDLSMLAFAYAKLGAGSVEMHQCIQKEILKHRRDLPADCLVRILYAYAQIGACESTFTHLQMHVLERLHQFHPRDLCTVLWSYAVMEFYDYEFFKTVLEFVNAQDLKCHLLYPALAITTAVEPKLLNAVTVRLMNHTKDAFWDWQMTESERFKAHVEKSGQRILKGLRNLYGDSLEVKVNANICNFMIDFIFSIRDEKYAMVLHHEYNTFGPNNRPMGHSLLKARYLKKQGFKVVHVLEDCFRECDLAASGILLSRCISKAI
ncbi:hypothetical protein BdWA1_001328 [Babesia duncani]|uniref:RAP domain-containing protein n=1 Tax=Babesia duncani TaxID=323732 RepID=A0AAD9PPG5_9APIC|nr:hypothetical protein BdWA1_001328 [Babesia duncani]